MKTCFWFGCAVLAVVSLIGCGQEESNPNPEPQVDGSRFILSAEPEGGKNVIEVREQAANDDDVVVVGRIGGSLTPFVEGRAAFSIVDLKLKACTDIEGDTCPTPWDYCCETTELPKAKVLVKFVDDGGNLVKNDARKLLKVKELQTVVVRGKAKRDDAGNLTVLATGAFVRK